MEKMCSCYTYFTMILKNCILKLHLGKFSRGQSSEHRIRQFRNTRISGKMPNRAKESRIYLHILWIKLPRYTHSVYSCVVLYIFL